MYAFGFFVKGNVLFDIHLELLSQFLYSEDIWSTVIGSHLENSRHFETQNTNSVLWTDKAKFLMDRM